MGRTVGFINVRGLVFAPAVPGAVTGPVYRTLSVNDGASHAIVQGGPILGTSVDSEADGQPTEFATGDDTDVDGDEELETVLERIAADIAEAFR